MYELMQFISDYRAVIMPVVAAGSLVALFFVLREIFRGALEEMRGW